MSTISSELPAEWADALEAARPKLAPLASRVLYFPSVGSTNDVALSLAASADSEGAVVLADQQTAGRGRRGRIWFSPPGSGLYVSTILAPGRARADAARATALLTLAAGVALAETVERVTGLPVVVKWPNDVYVGRRKLAGILAEAVAVAGRAAPAGVTSVVLGFGINVGPTAYPPEIADRATSIESELGRAVDRVQLGVESLAALAERYRDLLAGAFDGILDAWRVRAPGARGARVSWESVSGPRTGTTAGIADDGALLVNAGGHLERIVAGEVTWLP